MNNSKVKPKAKSIKTLRRQRAYKILRAQILELELAYNLAPELPKSNIKRLKSLMDRIVNT
jgi:hypothetical protein